MKIGQHYTPTTFAIFKQMADLLTAVRLDLDAIERSVPLVNRVEDRIVSVQTLLRDAIMKDAKVLPAIPNHDFDDPSDIAELLIVDRLVKDVIAEGLYISVWDGEEMTVVESSDEKEIFEALASTDGDVLYIHKAFGDKKPRFVSLIWGNGVDVISDYNTSLEGVLKSACDLAQELDR